MNIISKGNIVKVMLSPENKKYISALKKVGKVPYKVTLNKALDLLRRRKE